MSDIKESDDFIFKTGDIIHTKCDNTNYLLKIKEIDKRNNIVVVDGIVIRNYGTFDAYTDTWFAIERTEWNEYAKIEDSSEIFENLLNIINKYKDDFHQLTDDTYLKLKNEIAPYDN